MKENKNRQRCSVTEDHLEGILKTLTSFVTSRYDKRFADKSFSISYYVRKVIRTKIIFYLFSISYYVRKVIRTKIIFYLFSIYYYVRKMIRTKIIFYYERTHFFRVSKFVIKPSGETSYYEYL